MAINILLGYNYEVIEVLKDFMTVREEAQKREVEGSLFKTDVGLKDKTVENKRKTFVFIGKGLKSQNV